MNVKSSDFGEEESTVLPTGSDTAIHGGKEETEVEIARRSYKVKKMMW